MHELTRTIGAKRLRVLRALGFSGSVLDLVRKDRRKAADFEELKAGFTRRCREMGLPFQIDRLNACTCLWPLFMAFIDIDRHPEPCCLLEHIRLASRTEIGLFEAWNHTGTRALRGQILEGDFRRPWRDIHCAVH